MARRMTREGATLARPLGCLAMLALGGLTGNYVAAGDDVVDAPAAAATPAQTPAEDAPEGPFVVTLINGDRITGACLELDERRLRVRPDMAAGAEVDLPLKTIDSIDRTAPTAPLEPRGDRLFPVAGGVIHGSLSGIDARGITVDAHLIGQVTLPLDAVDAFVRDGSEPPERSAAARFHEIHDLSGSRLVGHVEFSPSGAAVVAEGVTATVALRQVAAILFPTDRRGVAADAEPSPPRCRLELLNGSEVVGVAPRLERDRLVVGIGPERSVAVPLDNVARMSFGSDGDAGGARRVVFWSQFADLDEEVAHMADALRAGLPRGWTLEADGPGPSADELAAALKTASVLVVPELENFNARVDVDAAAIGRDLKAFLGRGGTVVIAGIDNSTADFWEEVGVFSLSSMGRVEGDGFKFVRGHPLGRDVGDSFAPVNATYAFETEDPGLEPVARTPGGAAAVLVKKVGRGSVVLLGMDYFERSPAIDRVLVNAVTRGRGK